MVLGQVVAVLVLAVPVLQGRDSIIYSQARQMALARARLGADFLEHDVPRLSRAELALHLNAFLTTPDVLEARVVQGSKMLATVWRPPGEPHRESTATPDVRETLHGFMVTVPLRGIEPPTYLEFGFSTSSLRDQVAGVTARVLTLLSLALLAGLLAAYLVSLTIIRRVERIVAVTTAIAHRDLSPRLPEDGPTELATLSIAVNAMVDVVEAERVDTVGDMSTQLAHDMRNPLATLAVNLELLGDEVTGCVCGERVERHVQAIHRSLSRTNVALEEYLEFAGLSRVKLSPGDVNATLRAELASLADWLANKRIETRFELAPDLPDARLEPRRFRIAVRSLVRHAVDAMPAGGTLTLRTALGEGGVELRVSNTGAPIKDEIRQDLFKLFCGLRPNSTGPGLRLAREILKNHDGALDLEHTGDGGSTFLAVIPVPPPA